MGQTLAAEGIRGLNADSPPIRRGSALAMGAMPQNLLKPYGHKILSSLAAATKVKLCLAFIQFHPYSRDVS